MAEWPVEDDLKQWLRDESIAPSSNAAITLSFDSASEMLRDRINTDLLNCKALAAGIQTDPDEGDYDAAVLAAWCPSYVRQAILIRAAALFCRKDSANGSISFGEFATRVAKQDPDVEDLMSRVVLPGIA